MKYVSCLYLIFVFTVNTFAQKIKEEQLFVAKGLLDIQAGVAIPISDYGLQKLTLPAGYAQNGYNIKLGISYDIAPFLGLTAQYQYVSNPFNNDKILQDLSAAYPNQKYNSFTSKPWELQGMMLGLYYPFKTYKTSLDLRLLGAMLTGVNPESTQNITANNNQQFNFKQYETSAANFGFQVGIKVRRQLYKSLMLSASADYTYTEIEFTNIKVIETYRNITLNVPNYTQKFQIINISVGIGVQFN
jgi:hypothetical protein